MGAFGGSRQPLAPLRFVIQAAFVCFLFELLISSRERARSAEQNLRESERIYRAVGESIPFGVWICDKDGKNKYASDSLLKLTGMSREECKEFGWSRAVHPDESEQVIAHWHQCVREQRNWDLEFRFRGIDGKYYPVLARGVPVRDDDGRILCWAGINLDISRLKDAEGGLQTRAAELERSNRDLEQFAFAASHDLREPLRTVSIYSELLLRRLGPGRPVELDEFAGFIGTAFERWSA